MKKIVFVLLSLLVLNASSNTEDFDSVSSQKKYSHTETNLDKAICTATKALQEMSPYTRSHKECTFKNAYPVLSKRIATRSGNADTDTLLYLINFDQGFAIIGAQNCTDQIFAISDNSQISVTDTITNPVLAKMISSYAKFVEDKSSSKKVIDTQSEPIINVLQYMPPLVQSQWQQDDGFNALFPNNENVGCVPVAVAQVCYYHKKPQSLDGYQFNWNLMQNIKNSSNLFVYSNSNEEASKQVTRFLYELAKKMGTNNGSTYRREILPCLKSMGYEASQSALDINTVKWDILNGREPVILCGNVSGNSIGHAWVVDGYRETETKIPHTNNDDYDYQYDYYLHCNWGWGGIADGYYKYANSMGLFDFDTTHGADWGGNGTTSRYEFTDNLIMFYYIY